MSIPTLPLNRLYQFGFVTRDLDAAIETLRSRFGIAKYRRKQTTPSMEAIHAWVGDKQFEVLKLSEGAPQMYFDFIPQAPGEIRLQHVGIRVETPEDWEHLRAAIKAGGYETPLDAEVMDGNLKAIYVDTRALIGIYSEYVFLSGPALNMYDDVPHND
jgi:hypothetical protein